MCKFPKKNGKGLCGLTGYTDGLCGNHYKLVKKYNMNIDKLDKYIFCKDCRKPIELKGLCKECRDKRNQRAREKREKNKLSKINKVMDTNITDFEISPFYVAGFFDGDGSICITQGLSLQIQFSQCVKPVLEKLQSIFGGSMYSRQGKNENQRTQYSLRLCGRDCKKLLKYLDVGSIMKWDQIQIAKQFINLNNFQGLESRKIELREKMRRLNKSYKKTHNKPYQKMCWEYIAGIFDAEGCIYAKMKQRKNKTFRYLIGYIKISQKNDFQLLETIRKFVGHGRTGDKDNWKTERLDFIKYDLNRILPLLIVKKNQVKWCLDFIDSNDDNERKELYEKIKNDKHY